MSIQSRIPLTFRADGHFRILMVSDIQEKPEYDPRTPDALRALIAEEFERASHADAALDRLADVRVGHDAEANRRRGLGEFGECGSGGGRRESAQKRPA